MRRQRKPRYVALAVVLTAHVVVVGALASMRMAAPVLQNEEAMQVSLYEAPAPKRDVAAPPHPVMIETRVVVPNPEVPITLTPEPAAIVAAAIERPDVDAPGGGNDGPPRSITPADYLRPPATQYPPMARKQRQQGLVVLRVLIGMDGRPMEVQIERSSGFALLDRAARDAVRDALFKPYIENGVARNIQVLVPIEFTMSSRLAQAS